MRRFPLSILVAAALAFSAVAWSETPAPDAGVALAPAEFAAKFDQLWPIRDQPGILKQMLALTNASVKANPNSYEVLYRAARLKSWEADGQTNKKIKANYGHDGWMLGEQALKAKPGGAEGHYYLAIGMGNYSQAIGVISALAQGIEGKFVSNLDAAAKDPSIDHGGPIMVKGRYYFELPWPKRDLAKSRELLNKCIEKYPENLRCYLYLAETELKDDQPQKAKEAIEKVFAGSTDYDQPEARRVKEFAKPIAQKIQEELK
jgi:hypothetical protein